MYSSAHLMRKYQYIQVLDWIRNSYLALVDLTLCAGVPF